MHLSRIAEIGPHHADVLAGAGLTTAAELAAVADLEALSQRTNVHPSTLEALQAAARAHLERMLEAAGVRGVEDLADADLDALSRESGIPRANLETFQDAARQKLGLPPARREAAPARPALPDRVVLMDGRATARVHLQGEARAGLAIVTLRMDEDEAAVLSRAPGDAVLLRERAVTAPVRLGGVVHRDLPIYKERPVAEGAEAREEIRVRVTQIKDRKGVAQEAPAAAQADSAGPPGASETPRRKGFRLFGRGK
jgi:hypothetical protein